MRACATFVFAALAAFPTSVRAQTTVETSQESRRDALEPPAAVAPEDQPAPVTPDLPVGTEPAAAAPPTDDGRRTTSAFIRNLGRNAVGVVSRDHLKPFLITAAATGLGSLFDNNAVNYFGPRRRWSWLGDSGEQLGNPFVLGPIAIGLYVAGRLDHHHQSFRDASYDIAQVTLVAASYTAVLKFTTRRERPDLSNNQSFPSGHTANAFAWATIGAHYYGWRVGVPGYVLASLVGISRMEKNVHHLSDVLAGAGLGYMTAKAVLRREAEALPNTHATQISLAPARDAQGTGWGLTATVIF